LSLVLLAPAMPALAQSDSPDRVRSVLEITDRRIEQAEALVSGSEDSRAQVELAAAQQLQGRAWGFFGGAQFGLALKASLEARGHADRAIALVKGLPDPDRVRAQLERTRELLERARERIEECENDRARALMASALAIQARAEEAAAAGRYLAALQLTMSARERGLRALRLCHMEENRREAAERALRRTDEVLDRAREAVADCGIEAARETLGRSMQLQEQAWREFRGEHFDAALRLTQNARAIAFRAIRLCGATR
jgi:hypothetical protein